MTKIINICKGWGCDLSSHCEKSRYISEREREKTWIREHIPTAPGETCPDFEMRKVKRWGEGAEAVD
jgi:tartrate dehydratase alpha subunit/fumarate hydratase class I-like protein